jgi:diguanylate cyclase (GGDEF)-like protein
MNPFTVAPEAMIAPALGGLESAVAAINGKGASAGLPPFLFDAEMASNLRRMEGLLAGLEEAQRLIEEQRERIAYLESLSSTDELTGLINRRGFNQHFQRELGHAERDPAQGGLLLMIDLDGFKEINDTLGHAAGDAYLRCVARLLAGHVRHQDVVARLGGDEFAVLLTSTDAADAEARVSDLVAQVNAETFTWHGQTLPVRLSLGVCPYGANDRAEVVLRQADARMYADKRRRRDGQRRAA